MYGAPPAAPPGYDQTAYAAAPLGSAAPLPPPTPKKKSRAGLVIGLLVVLVLVVGGGLAAVLLAGGGSDAELTVDTCEIAADGSLTATGTVTDGGDGAIDIDVSFLEVGSGQEIQDESVTVQLVAGAGAWSASGTAGDSVTQVTCEATLDD